MADSKGNGLPSLASLTSTNLLLIVNPTTGYLYNIEYAYFLATFLQLSGGTLTGDLVGKDFIKTRNITITRSGGYISSIAKTGGRTLTITRDSDNLISSVNDGTRTYTITRDSNKYISSVAVTTNP